jgi:hypothetical protein
VADDWADFGVRAELEPAWQALGLQPFEAALAQGDGYGPESARHYLRQLRAVAATWRQVGLASAEGLQWHRAGFGAREAARWLDSGSSLDAAALASGHRMVG